MNKVLYIGAGDDINIINIFNKGGIKCNEFILIDTLPRSSYDDMDFYVGFYRPNFVDEIKQEFKSIGFELKNITELEKIKEFNKIDLPFINPHLLEFIKGNKIVKYYISTNINKFMNNELRKDLIESDTLYIKGYFPEIKLFDYFKLDSKKKIFVGDEDTIYKKDIYDDINIINYNYNADDYFSSYYIYINEMLIKCDKKYFAL
jgi:hypothetical protein